MGPNREEFQDSDVNSGLYSEDYGCSFIGVIASLIIIVAVLTILFRSTTSYSIGPIGPPIPNTDLTDFEIIFVPEATIPYLLALSAVLIYWLYSRRNRSTLEAV